MSDTKTVTRATVISEVGSPDVLIVEPNCAVADVIRFKGYTLDNFGWYSLEMLDGWGETIEIHAAEEGDDGYLRVYPEIDDDQADLALIRYGDHDWTVEFDRHGDGRLTVDELFKLGNDIHHVVWMANQLNTLKTKSVKS